MQHMSVSFYLSSAHSLWVLFYTIFPNRLEHFQISMLISNLSKFIDNYQLIYVLEKYNLYY